MKDSAVNLRIIIPRGQPGGLHEERCGVRSPGGPARPRSIWGSCMIGNQRGAVISHEPIAAAVRPRNPRVDVVERIHERQRIGHLQGAKLPGLGRLTTCE